MRKFDIRIVWGVLLIVAGLVFLANNFLSFNLPEYLAAGLFIFGGLSFLYVLATDRRNWWAVIPGLVLIDIGVIILLDQLLPAFSEIIGGAVFLFTIALAFWIVYLMNRTQWWAIIPAGVLTTLSLVTLSSSIWTDEGTFGGSLFFLGLGLTFVLLYLLPTGAGRMRWPLIPGGILLLMGTFMAAFSSSALRWLWPVALIGVGLYLFFFRGSSRSV